MTVTFCKLSLLGVVVILLTGCSFGSEIPVAGQWKTQQRYKPAKVVKTDALKACLPKAGTPFHFRKDILVVGTIGVPELSRDLPGLTHLTSMRLQTHLDALERFNVLATHNLSFNSVGPGTTARVQQLGREHGSQFVIKLEIEDLTILSSGVLIPKLISVNAQRNVLMKLYIYGTEHGTLFHSQQYQDTVRGKVVGYPGNGNTVTTPWFDSDLGSKIDEMLKAMSMQINEKLACVPFSTDVAAVEGNKIKINAGYLHGIRPGATLRVYPSSDMLESQGEKYQQGVEEWVKVHAVFPNHSIASATQDNIGGNRVDIGDVVRAW